MDVRDRLEELTPELPTTGLAAGARRRFHRRRAAQAGTGMTALAVVAVGAATLVPGPWKPSDAAVPEAGAPPTQMAVTESGGSRKEEDVPAAAQAASENAPSDEALDGYPVGALVAGKVLLAQGPDDERARICFSVGYSEPAQCGAGAWVTSAVPWDEIDATNEGGSRWFEGWVVGRFDNETGAFTLDRAPSTEQPDGAKESVTATPDIGYTTLPDSQRALEPLMARGIVVDAVDVTEQMFVVAVYADEQARAQIQKAVAPYFSPDQIRILSLLTPLEGERAPAAKTFDGYPSGGLGRRAGDVAPNGG